MVTDVVTEMVDLPAGVIHDFLTRAHSDAYEAWRRQEVVVDAMRADVAGGSGSGADRSVGQAQLGEQIAVAAALRRHVDELAAAVERSENGKYGICIRCGDPIPAERLEVFPASTLCVACKQDAEHQ